jgi:hypothetical protein
LRARFGKNNQEDSRVNKASVWSKPWLAFSAVLMLVTVCLVCRIEAQQNAVWQSSTQTVASAAFIDASIYTGTGNNTDFCAKLNAALSAAASSFPQGAVIDARGLTSINTNMICPLGATPWVYGSSIVTLPSTVLLPDAEITISNTWVLPNGTRLVGAQTTDASGANNNPYPTLLAASPFTPPTSPDTSNAMIEMGSGATGICPNGGPCYGISVEHLTLDGDNITTAGGAPLNGIYNGYAQDQSYTNDLDLKNLTGTGLFVDVPSGASSFGGATGSGPYSTIDFTPQASASAPICVQLNAQTRGIHGATCIGSQTTAPTTGCGSANLAGIYVNAGNNTLDDIHIESFCDGIQVGNTTANTSNVVISNLVTAHKGANGYNPTQNSIHICGPHPHSQFGQCATTSVNISDVTVLQVSATSGGTTITGVEDDVTGTSISNTSTVSVGIYSLGEAPSGGYGYSRFSTSPSASSNGSSPYSTAVPTWGVGVSVPANDNCTTPGALYSTTGGASGDAIFVCTTALVWSPIA